MRPADNMTVVLRQLLTLAKFLRHLIEIFNFNLLRFIVAAHYEHWVHFRYLEYIMLTVERLSEVLLDFRDLVVAYRSS